MFGYVFARSVPGAGMGKRKSFRFGTRLGAGFGICLLFTLIVGVVGIRSNAALSRLTADFHSHPFTVTNALRKANADIIETRSTVREMVSLVDSRSAAPFISIIKDRERNVEVQLGIVKERYLGPPEDVDNIIRDYGSLKAVRERIIALVRNGDFRTARELADNTSRPIYQDLQTDMNTILAFADAKAAAFLEDANRMGIRVQSFTWMTLAGAVTMALIAAWLTTRSITRPLTLLKHSMQALSDGDLGVAIPGVERKDEIGQMARVLQVFKDSLIHSEKMEQTLRQTHKMEAIGQLTGGIAHDFNNLLQVILTDIELSLLQLDDESPITHYLESAASEVERGAKLTGQLLAFARRQPLNPKPLRIDRLVSGMVTMLRRTLSERIDIEVVNGGGVWNALVDANQLENAILNLAVNARDAMPGGGKLTFEVGNTALDAAYAADHAEVKPGQYVMLAVTDTGSGMSPEVMQKAFDPFFTTKPEGIGTGLGLSMVFGFVKQSEGHVKIYSELGVGTTIKLYVPRASGAEMVREAVETKARRGSGETILVAEDDAGVRSSVVAQLAELGYRVLAAANGEEAVDILSRGERIDLLFTDVIMPGTLNGRALAEKAKEIIPTLPVVFTSGYTENAIIHNGRLDEGVTLLSKPYRLPQLAETIHTALTAPPAPVVVAVADSKPN